MGVKLVSSGGGSVEINPPATASSFIATMPAGTGNVVVNGINSALVSGTAVASTSGTSIDFTGIPSWVRRITVMFSGVSTNGTSVMQVQVGTSSGFATTGYVTTCTAFAGTGLATQNFTSGFGASTSGVMAASASINGSIILLTLGSNAWVGQHSINLSTTQTAIGAGAITLGGTLDRVRITTVNGTDTFDAGSINILYE